MVIEIPVHRETYPTRYRVTCKDPAGNQAIRTQCEIASPFSDEDPSGCRTSDSASCVSFVYIFRRYVVITTRRYLLDVVENSRPQISLRARAKPVIGVGPVLATGVNEE